MMMLMLMMMLTMMMKNGPDILTRIQGIGIYKTMKRAKQNGKRSLLKRRAALKIHFNSNSNKTAPHKLIFKRNQTCQKHVLQHLCAP